MVESLITLISELANIWQIAEKNIWIAIILAIALVVLTIISIIRKRKKGKHESKSKVNADTIQTILLVLIIILIVLIIVVMFVGVDPIISAISGKSSAISVSPTPSAASTIQSPDPISDTPEPVSITPDLTNDESSVENSVAFVTSWKNILGSDVAVGMLPFNRTIEVYPSEQLSVDERKENLLYKNAFADNTDKITIHEIYDSPQGLVAKIEYPLSGSDDTKTGYVHLKTLIDVKSDEQINKMVTNQSTAVFDQPNIDSKKRNVECIKPGIEVYLLTRNDEWQQIMYYVSYEQWTIKWVKYEELSSGQTCTITNDSAHIRQQGSLSSSVVTNVYKGEVYTIRDESKNANLPWYYVYVKGKSGWVCSTMVTVNEPKE